MGVIVYSGMMWKALADDVDVCQRYLQQDDLPATRRQLVRAIFALIEASTYYGKREALGVARDKGHKVHVLAEAALLDVGYAVSSKGKIEAQSARIPLANNIKLSLRALATFVAPGFDPPFGDSGWEKLRLAIRIRDRLTHPKSLKDLEVSDEDLATVRAGFNWYRLASAAIVKIASDNAKAAFDSILEKGKQAKKDEHQ